MATDIRDSIKGMIGTEVGVSDWPMITQEMVNQFTMLIRDPL